VLNKKFFEKKKTKSFTGEEENNASKVGYRLTSSATASNLYAPFYNLKKRKENLKL